MYKELFTTQAEKTVESVNAAIEKETGDRDWEYKSIEEIEKAEREGFLEFNDGNMTVYADMN